MATTPDVLRVAYPRECNTQQHPSIGATVGATTAQQGGLKALALAALGRNSTRNNPAQDHQKSAQQTPCKSGLVVARLEQEPVALLRCTRDATTQQRPVVHFRLPDDPPNNWATALGAMGDTCEAVASALRERWPDAEIRAIDSERKA